MPHSIPRTSKPHRSPDPKALPGELTLRAASIGPAMGAFKWCLCQPFGWQPAGWQPVLRLWGATIGEQPCLRLWGGNHLGGGGGSNVFVFFMARRMVSDSHEVLPDDSATEVLKNPGKCQSQALLNMGSCCSPFDTTPQKKKRFSFKIQTVIHMSFKIWDMAELTCLKHRNQACSSFRQTFADLFIVIAHVNGVVRLRRVLTH